MKFIKYVFIVCFAIIISGCTSLQNLAVAYESNNSKEFETYVDTLEKRMKQRYENYGKGLFAAPSYIVREDYYNPRHTKLKLFYSNNKVPHMLFSYQYVVYIIKNEHDNEIIIRERSLRSNYLEDLKCLILNNMECEK